MLFQSAMEEESMSPAVAMLRPRHCNLHISLPITPPAIPDELTIVTTTTTTTTTTPSVVDCTASCSTLRLLDRAVNVLTTEATALSYVSRLYQTDPRARTALVQAVAAIVAATRRKNKLIICGVGKSAYVGLKLAATLKSLGLACSFLHAAEALHGDLGDVHEGDIVLFISYSGKTAELVTMASHLPTDVTIMALTAHPDAETCPLLCFQPGSILLPAPIHELEAVSFGLSAPTSSTTVAMAIGDMLALTAADLLHQGRSGQVFMKNHPGGAIGAAAATSMAVPVSPQTSCSDDSSIDFCTSLTDD